MFYYSLHRHCGESKPVLLVFRTQPPTALAVLLTLSVDTSIQTQSNQEAASLLTQQDHHCISSMLCINILLVKMSFCVCLAGMLCESEAFVCADLASEVLGEYCQPA